MRCAICAREILSASTVNGLLVCDWCKPRETRHDAAMFEAMQLATETNRKLHLRIGRLTAALEDIANHSVGSIDKNVLLVNLDGMQARAKRALSCAGNEGE